MLNKVGAIQLRVLDGWLVHGVLDRHQALSQDLHYSWTLARSLIALPLEKDYL